MKPDTVLFPCILMAIAAAIALVIVVLAFGGPEPKSDGLVPQPAFDTVREYDGFQVSCTYRGGPGVLVPGAEPKVGQTLAGTCTVEAAPKQGTPRIPLVG